MESEDGERDSRAKVEGEGGKRRWKAKVVNKNREGRWRRKMGREDRERRWRANVKSEEVGARTCRYISQHSPASGGSENKNKSGSYPY